MTDIDWDEPLGAWDDDPDARARRAAAAEVFFAAAPSAEPFPEVRRTVRSPLFGRRAPRARDLTQRT
jgi:hypothetical protein